MTDRRVEHDTFSIGKDYSFAPATVFAAWADPAAKRHWFAGTEGFDGIEYALDFRVGGEERCAGNHPGGQRFTYDAVIHDIVADERIVLAYRMTMDGTPISVSLATITFEPAGEGTRLTYTEQAAFLDGLDNAGPRRMGVAAQLDTLARQLAGETETIQ
jgi:uncharacterized protein YndB with AHSA1/START domain